MKGSNQIDKLQREQFSKSCFHHLRKIKRCRSPFLNTPLSSLDSVLHSILPSTPSRQKKALGSCNLCLKFWGSTRCPSTQVVVYRPSLDLCVLLCEEDTRLPRKEHPHHGRGWGTSLFCVGGERCQRCPTSPQLRRSASRLNQRCICS